MTVNIFCCSRLDLKVRAAWRASASLLRLVCILSASAVIYRALGDGRIVRYSPVLSPFLPQLL